MINVSDAFHEAFKSDYREIFTRITIKDTVYTNDNLTSFEYEGGSITGETFSVGSTFSNSVKMTFCEIIEGLQELDEVKVDIGIKYLRKCICKVENGKCTCKCEDEELIKVVCDCTDRKCKLNCKDGKCDHWCEVIEYCPMGIFLISEKVDVDRNENKTIVECMDRMIMLENTYESKLSYPAPIREVALEIANMAGVKVNTTSFARLSAATIAKPEGYTHRQALGLIAQFEAGFVTFDRDDLLDIRTLKNTGFVVTADEYFLKGLVKNDLMYRLSGIQAKIQTTNSDEEIEMTLQAGSSSGSQILLENNVMRKALLEAIFNKLKGLNYYPFTLNWRGNPALEAGDWIAILDKDGNRFYAPNLSYKLTFNGGLTAESSAETTTQSESAYQYKGGLNQKIEWINTVIRKHSGNANFYGIDKPNPEVDNLKVDDLWYKPNGNFTEMYMWNGTDWVFVISTDPETFPDGSVAGEKIFGTLSGAILNIIELNASNITTGELLADFIRGGTLVLGEATTGKLLVYDDGGEPEVDVGQKNDDGEYVSGFNKIVVNDLKVTGEVSGELFVTNRKSGTIYVNEDTGEDDVTLKEALAGSVVASLQYALNLIPEITSGHVTIVLQTNVQAQYDDDNDIDYFSAQGYNGLGSVSIDLNGKIMYGYLRIQDNTSQIQILSNVATKGSIRTERHNVIDCSRSTDIIVKNINGDGGDSAGAFVYARAVTNINVENCSCKNVSRGIQAAYGSHVYVTGGFTGTVAESAYSAYYGGSITANCDSNPSGGTLTSIGANGNIYTKVTTSNSTSTTVTAATKKTKVKAFSSTNSNQYRSSGGWGATGTKEVLQGKWNTWGPYNSLWIFNVNLTAAQRAAITKVRVKITRRAAGGASAASITKIKCHQHTSIPSGAPSYIGSTHASAKFAWGESKWVDITSIAKTQFATGGAMGVGLVTEGTTAYQRFLTSATLEITYKE